jgi:hypothetical protein
MDRLTDEELSHYREQGYILYKKPVLPQATFDELERRFNAYYKDHMHTDVWDCMHWDDPWFWNLLTDKELIDNLVEPIVGPNIALFASSFLYKPPYTGKATPWHEDSAYFMDRLDRFDNMVTIWLAIDPSTRENGCMKVIPGTHNNGFSEYKPVDEAENTFTAIVAQEINEDDAVYFELDKNECSLHDSRIIHGGNKNNSPYRRCGFQMRYMPTSVKFDPHARAGFKGIYFVRGEDLAGNVYVNV